MDASPARCYAGGLAMGDARGGTMGEKLPNQDVLDQLRRAVEESIARGAALGGALPDGTAGRLERALAWATDLLARSPSDLARDFHHHQLRHHLLALGNWRLTVAERVIEPFGVPGLVVTARGVPGAARVVVYGAEPGGRRAYADVPTAGDARSVAYELLIADQPPDHWASGPAVHLRTADPAEVARAIVGWCDAVPLPVLEVPPLGSGDLKPLRALAATRAAIAAAAAAGAAPTALGLVVACDPAAPVVPHPVSGQPPIALAPDGAAALAADLAALDAPRLLANLPRDARGQLALGVEVALAPYASDYDDPAGGTRRSRVWLLARTPLRRRDPQVVALVLALCVGDDRRHRWDGARWLWDGRDVSGEADRWGVAGLGVAGLGLAGRADRIAALRERPGEAGEALTDGERATLCILLQDEGQLAEALALYGLTLDDRLLAILRGDPDGTLPADYATHWPPALWAALRALAPWRCEGLLRAEEARLAARASRRRKPARLRLLALPKQPQIAKASVMLVRGEDSRPRLELEVTGSTAIVPEVAWQRPVELDLRRFGLECSPAPPA